MRSIKHHTLVISLALAVTSTSIAYAQEKGATRARRLRFDTDRGRWVDLPTPEPGTAAGDLAVARTAFAAREYKKASKSLKAWIKTYGADSELYPQALLLQARTAKARRNYYKAHGILKTLLADYTGTEVATEAAFEEYNIAEVFLSGVRRKLWGMRLLKADNLALDILDAIATRFPDSQLAERAIKRKADHYFRQGDFSLSEMEYSRLVQTFPRTRYRRYAMRRGAEAALASFRGVRFDDASLIEAEERYRLFAAQYRGAAEREGVGLILDDIRQKRASKEFEIGAYYQRTHHPEAAAAYYRSTMDLWPNTIAATRARTALGRVASDDIEPSTAEEAADQPDAEQRP